MGRAILVALSSNVRLAWVQAAAVLGIMAAIQVSRPVDADFWWHYATGRLIFQGGIPRTDPYSWSVEGEVWVAHEWLSEALIYGIGSTVGHWANMVVFGCVFVGAMLSGYLIGRRRGAGTRMLNVILLLSALMIGPFVTVRPQAFSWLLFGVFVFVIERWRRDGDAPVWLLPPLMAVWANLHLGFTFGFLVLGAWGGATCWDLLRHHTAEWRTPLLVTVACVGAAALNPYGLDLLVYPLRYWEDRTALAFVAEWSRPNALFPLHWPIFAGQILVVSCVLSRTRPDPFMILIASAIAAASALAVRNAPFLAVILPAIVGPTLASRWYFARQDADQPTKMRLLPAILLTAAVVATVGALGVYRTGSWSLVRPSEYRYPESGAEYVAVHLSEKRLFNDYSWGGYLIYKLYPHTPVFIDGRTDLYRSAAIKRYLQVRRLEPGWSDQLDEMEVEVVFLPKASRMAGALRVSEEWNEAFTGPVESVFVRLEPLAERSQSP